MSTATNTEPASALALYRFREKLLAVRPDGIREKVAAWALDGAADVPSVLRKLESIDCVGCHSPAPYLCYEMAAEIALHWPEIDEALDAYRAATGRAWTPKPHQNFLYYLWFAYEWAARTLARDIRREYGSHGV